MSSRLGQPIPLLPGSMAFAESLTIGRMKSTLRSALSGFVDWLLAEKPDRAVFALAIAGAVATGAVCVPRGFERNGIQVPAAAAWGIVALGVAIAVLAALRAWPGLLAWIVAMPFFTAARIGPVVGWVQLTSTTVILATVACSIVLGFRRTRPNTPTAPLALAGLIVALAVLATTISPDLSTSVSITLHGIIEPVVVGVLIVIIRPTLRQLVALAGAMAASVVIAGAVNLVRIVLVVHHLGDFQALRNEFGRITFYNVGLFGAMLATVLPLIAIVIVRPGLISGAFERAGSALGRASSAVRPGDRADATLRLAGAVIFGFLLLEIALTFSKSAWIACAVVALGLALALPGTWRRRGVGLVGIGVVAVFFVLISSVTAAKSSDRNNSFDPNSAEGEASITARFQATRAAVHMAIDHPLLGVGPGLFGYQYAGRYRSAEVKDLLQSAHDMIPNIAAEYGLPLALIFSLTVLAALLASVRTWLSGAGLARLLALTYGLALAAFMTVATLFGTDLYRTYRYMNTDVVFLGLLLGAIAVLASRATDVDEGAVS
jgi:hypothetical protein